MTCVVCARAFEPTRKRRVCSEACRHKLKRRAEREGVTVAMYLGLVCDRCGEPLGPHRERFCSEACRRVETTRRKNAQRQARDLLRRGMVRRHRIIDRDGSRCWMCGRAVWEGAVDPRHRLTLDHLVPLSYGGSDEEENLAVACQTCNGAKGARLVGFARWGDGTPRLTGMVA